MISVPQRSRLKTQAAYSVIGVVLGVFLLCGTGCRSARLPVLMDGGEGTDRGGRLRFEVQVSAAWHADTSGIDVTVGVANDVLVFVRNGEKSDAEFDMFVRAGASKEDRILADTVLPRVRTVAAYEATQDWVPEYCKFFLALPSGEYEITVGFRDLASKRSASWIRTLLLPAAERGKARLLSVTMTAATPGGSRLPLLLPHFPADYDSVEASVTLLLPGEPIDIWFTVVRYPSDTSIATPIGAPALRQNSSLAHRGVDYGQPDTVLFSKKTLTPGTRVAQTLFGIGKIPKGVYRISTSFGLPLSGVVEPVDVFRRDIAVLSPGFPRLSSLEEIIPTHSYIASDEERDSLLAGGSPVALRRRFEEFWLAHFSPQEAKEKIKLYSQRVTESNIVFSTYKEGWRTDRGMVFIVLGPPLRGTEG